MIDLAQASLIECEAVIRAGLATFMEVGAALQRIRDARLYRQSHGTFEDYCRERWQLKRQRAYELMEAAQVVGALSEISDTPPPSRESHAAELAPLRKEPEQMREAWSDAVAEHGPDPTAAQTREAVRQRLAAAAEPIIDEAERDLRLRRVRALKLLAEVEAAGAFAHGNADVVDAAQQDDGPRHAARLRESARLLDLVADQITTTQLRMVR